MYFFLKFNLFSQKHFAKLWIILHEASGVQLSILWKKFAWLYVPNLKTVLMTVQGLFFFSEKCLCVHPFAISFSVSGLTLLPTCCWFLTYFQHIWSNVCDLSVRYFLRHLCDPLLDFLPISSTGEPITGPCTPDVSHQAEQRARISSLDLLAKLCLMQPRILLAAFAARAC